MARTPIARALIRQRRLAAAVAANKTVTTGQTQPHHLGRHHRAGLTTAASYARQAEDDALLTLSTRIKARAIRRLGELLKAIEPSGGGRPSKTGTAAGTSLTRKQAAASAGVSKRQKDTALRDASIPAAEFEAAVESDAPPTIGQLAARGTKRNVVDLEGRAPAEFNAALHAAADIERLAAKADECSAEVVARADRSLPNSPTRSILSWPAT